MQPVHERGIKEIIKHAGDFKQLDYMLYIYISNCD